MIVLIFGPPGSGKGTQAKLLSEAFALVHVAPGDILRAEVAKGSDLGKRVGPLMKEGLLVPDGVIVDLMQARLHENDARGGLILDGFPRTIAQAETLGEMLNKEQKAVDAVILLKVSHPVLINRVLARAHQEGRADDTAEAIEQRMTEYERKTAPVLQYYDALGVHATTVDGSMSVDNVFAAISAVLQEIRSEVAS